MLKNGEVVKGEMDKVDTLTFEEYRKIYESFREANTKTILVPAIDEKLTVTALSEQPYEYLFSGFDLNLTDTDSYPEILLLLKNENRLVEVRLDVIRELSGADSSKFIPARLSDAILSGVIPVMSQINIRTHSRIEEIDYDAIKDLEYGKIYQTHGDIAGIRTIYGRKTYFNDKGGTLYYSFRGQEMISGEGWDGKGTKLPLTEVNSLYFEMPEKSEFRAVPINEFDYLGEKNGKSAKWIFLSIGVAIDVGLIALGIAMSGESYGLGSGGGGSW
jgi:hypothetical protein